MATTPAEANLAAADREALHFLDGAFGICLTNELDKATVLANGDLHLKPELASHLPERVLTYIVDLAKRREEGAQSLF